DRARIFERFDRGSAPDPRREGAGLGLSIVQAIVDAHHGTVEVADTPGGGATFTISLPRHRSAAARPGRTTTPDERTTA
ncbi:MAG: HAMP domain-containing sensor histidine kinase, partial [Actinomycetota bacterium]